MSRKIISKRSDSQVLLLRKVRDGKDRAMVFCEGEKLVTELFQSDWRPRSIFCTNKTLPFAEKLIPKSPSIPITVLSEDVMAFCSDLSSPQGLIALAKPPERPSTPRESPGATLGLVIHGVQLPQNVGALLRTAEAAGVTDVLLSSTSADPWGPKALRGSSGSAFRVRIDRVPMLMDIRTQLKRRGMMMLAASQNGRMHYDEVDWRKPVALVVGSEGAGFSSEELTMFDQTIKIPMQGRVESLNVATAAAVCLFEAARQRRHGR